MTNEQDSRDAEWYLGLSTADPDTLDKIYTLYKQPVVRLITLAGGSTADGAVFFRTALVEMSRMSRQARINPETEFLAALRHLAMAHYSSWLEEREQALPEMSDFREAPEFVPPSEAELQHTRNAVFVWKQLFKLPKPARFILTESYAKQKSDAEIARETGKTEAFVRAQKPVYLAEFGSFLRKGPNPDNWPEWVAEALRDTEGLQFWEALLAAEQRLEHVIPSNKGKGNAVAGSLFLAMVLFTLGYAAWLYLNRPKPAEEIYSENFDPPKSILMDMSGRYGPARGNDSIAARQNHCEYLFEKADRYFRNEDYVGAKDVLIEITDDPNTVCLNDGLYYLGIVFLLQGEPDPALACFSKIDNLEAYGEDIYWYQALCFVKLTETYPGLRDKAARAVERFLSQTVDENRRSLAEKMLSDLGN